MKPVENPTASLEGIAHVIPNRRFPPEWSHRMGHDHGHEHAGGTRGRAFAIGVALNALAVRRRVVGLDLHGGVVDVEPRVELVLEATQKSRRRS